MKFWDTSAIVPLYMHEPNSTIVQHLIAEDSSIVVWWGTHSECISALMRQVRSGGFTTSDEHAARQVLHTLMQSWAEIQPGEALRNTAERLLAVHPLRAADALQLAAAIQWCQGLTTGQGLVAFDQRLRDAAYREGFTVLPGSEGIPPSTGAG